MTLRPTLIVPLALALFGCGEPRTESGAIIDVRPLKLSMGDSLVVEGHTVARAGTRRSFRPAASFRAGAQTRVILDGTFLYPGRDRSTREEQKRLELGAFAAPALADKRFSERVTLVMNEQVRRLIGYAHFEGQLGVAQQPKEGPTVTHWTRVELQFFPPNMRSLADLVASWTVDKQVLSWLGIEVGRGQGLEVTRVDPEGAGKRAGLQAGDRLLKVNGVLLGNARPLTIAARKLGPKKHLALQVKRGEREMTIRVAGDKAPWVVPITLVYLMVMLVFAVVALSIALGLAGILTWVERRVAARIQSRIGPNRVGPQGVLQWLADGIKLLLKEDVVPDAVDKPLFKLAPYLVFVGLLGTFVVLPFGQFLIISDLNVGLLYLIAITGFVSLGLMMAGWSSNNKWALLGGMRSAAQIISYEIPAGLALMIPVILAGSLSTHTIVEQQGGMPWQWFLFDNPFAFIGFFIYFISALAEGNRVPFDLPEAESELVAGYQIEYSGWRFAVFMMSEWANIFVIGAVATTVYLGGWQVPGLSVVDQAAHWGWQALGLGIFFGKAMALTFVIIWIRWTLPRFRVDQMMALCWKYFVPWTFLSIVMVALWSMLAPPWMRLLGALGTTGLCGGGLGLLFIMRVVHNWKQNPEKRWSWNPFY